jgi:hypothetical protein
VPSTFVCSSPNYFPRPTVCSYSLTDFRQHSKRCEFAGSHRCYIVLKLIPLVALAIGVLAVLVIRALGRRRLHPGMSRTTFMCRRGTWCMSPSPLCGESGRSCHFYAKTLQESFLGELPGELTGKLPGGLPGELPGELPRKLSWSFLVTFWRFSRQGVLTDSFLDSFLKYLFRNRYLGSRAGVIYLMKLKR